MMRMATLASMAVVAATDLSGHHRIAQRLSEGKKTQLHGTPQAAQLLLLERGAARVAEQQQGLPYSRKAALTVCPPARVRVRVP